VFPRNLRGAAACHGGGHGRLDRTGSSDLGRRPPHRSRFGYWQSGDYSFSAEHPPFAKLLYGLPLLFTDARVDTSKREWQRGEMAAFGSDFLYANRVPAGVMLSLARAVAALLTLLLALLLVWWTARRFGRVAGLIALGLFTLDPNFIAHGHIAGNDVPLALMVFATVVVWLAYLETGRWRDLLLSGIVVGLALVIKFSSVLVLPAMIALLAIQRW
jgi:dolichyl-phosphate-mannose--protein O-mannosyl transferase